MNATCGGCANTWSGATTAHCACCHRTFTRPSNFDRHRRGGECVDPATVGLILRGAWWQLPGRGEESPHAVSDGPEQPGATWATPEGHEAAERARGVLQQARQTNTVGGR